MTRIQHGWFLGTREPVLTGPNDLLTHLICVGATGSGKSGYLLSYLAQLWVADPRVNTLIIDFKGGTARQAEELLILGAEHGLPIGPNDITIISP